MAQPVADAYSAPSGSPVYLGRFHSGGGNALTLTGPSSGLEKSLSPQVFMVSYAGTIPGTVTITPSDGAGGQFWPLSYAPGAIIQISATNPVAKFWYCPGAAGAKLVSVTNDGGLSNPTSRAYTATAATGTATPFRLVRGGTTIGSYATLQQCKDSGGWQSGDVVKCAGGSYTPYEPTDPGQTNIRDNTGGVQTGVGINTLTIEADDINNPMVLDCSRLFQAEMWGGGQPQALTMGSSCRSLTLRGVHIRGSRPPLGTSWFGAAIWTALSGAAGTATLTVDICKISECPDGVKTQDARYDLSTIVKSSLFVDNSDNRGLDHDIYTGRNDLTQVEGCTFRKTSNNPYPQNGMGHFVKSRCRRTIMRGNLLDGWMSAGYLGGVAQSINTPNGGVVEITGNTINYYGSLTTESNGNPLRHGDDQHTANVDTSTDPALTTHSLLFAQNTVRQYLGRAPDGAEPHVLQIYPTGVATTLLNGAGSQVAVTSTVRNNIVGYDYPGARMTQFLSNYPDNNSVSASTLSDVGLYSGTAITGSPAVNDAALEWAGELKVAVARSGTNRGGRTSYTPSWVPTTAWQWKSIPGTTWDDYMRQDGAGIAPAITNLDPGPSKSYAATWEYSGPTYSYKNHEFWMFGGGHAGTTINCVTRYELGKESPNVVMVCLPTTEAIRNAEALSPNYATYASTLYWSDGKPHSPHSYHNNIYLDSVNEFVSFGVANCVGSSDNGASLSGGSTSGPDIAALTRSGTWRAADTYADFPAAVVTYQGQIGLRAVAEDGTAIYYWVTNTNSPRAGLNKYTVSTNTHTYVGGIGYESTKCADEHAGKVLIVNNSQTAGWVGRLIDVTTGAATPVAFTVNGAALSSSMNLYELVWVSDLGCWLAVWVNSGAVAWPNLPGNMTSIMISKVTQTSSTTMTVDTMPVAAGDGAPTRCGAVRGVFYDPSYQCLLLCFTHAEPIKAIKVT